MHVAPSRVGKQAFLGNSGMTAPGRSVPNRGLVGVLSATPRKAKKGSSWLGLPPTPLSRSPFRYLKDRLTNLDLSPDPLPEQAPPPPAVEGATHAVQLLRTYPDLRLDRDYPFANGGERSVARGYTKALTRAKKIIYVEDQYLWGHHVGNVFTEALRENPDLHVIAVVPLHPDLDGASRVPQLVGRRRAMKEMLQAAPGRVAVYGIENHAGTPVYVHAKACIIDDTWATIGSDNFNRRSWTHDSELSAVVVDRAGGVRPHAAADPGRRAPRPHPASGGRPGRGARRLRRAGRHVRGVQGVRGPPRRVARRRPARRATPRPAAGPASSAPGSVEAGARLPAVPLGARPRRAAARAAPRGPLLTPLPAPGHPRR